MENKSIDYFDDIRPIRDHEVEAAIHKITSDPYFRQTVVPYIEAATWKNLIQTMERCKTVYDFQRTVSTPILLKLFDVTQSGVGGALKGMISNAANTGDDTINILASSAGLNPVTVTVFGGGGNVLKIYKNGDIVLRLHNGPLGAVIRGAKKAPI